MKVAVLVNLLLLLGYLFWSSMTVVPDQREHHDRVCLGIFAAIVLNAIFMLFLAFRRNS